VFQEIFGALKALHAECVNKSKDEKQTADFRSLNHTKGLGVEQSIGVCTAILEESAFGSTVALSCYRMIT